MNVRTKPLMFPIALLTLAIFSVFGYAAGKVSRENTVIFDIDGVVPVWGPHMEDSEEFLGADCFLDNIFRDRCGVYINSQREVIYQSGSAELGVPSEHFQCR